MMMYVLFLVGFVLLIKGAGVFVDGSVGIAKAFGVPSAIIGLTIVAAGTSSPELFVSLGASLSGSNEIALSNVLGSNIFNLMIVVGLSALVKPAKAGTDLVKRDLPVLVISSLGAMCYLWDGKIDLIEGISFVLVIVSYFGYLIWEESRKPSTKRMGSHVVVREKNSIEDKKIQKKKPLLLPGRKGFLIKNIGKMVLGLGVVIFATQMIVDNAVKIALFFGLSETFIGLTIIAMGTSLPELTTSLYASKKGDSGLALGNAIGSNIFNVFCILGVCSLTVPLMATKEALIDGIILLLITLGFAFVCVTKKEISKKSGLGFIFIYVLYMIYITMR